MLNWHASLCGHSVVQHILLKQGRDSREAAKPTWEFKNGCLDIFYAHIEGLAFGLAQPNRAKAKQTLRALFQCQGKQQTANGRATGAEHLHGKMTVTWVPPLPGSLLRTQGLSAAPATAFRAAILAWPTLPGIPGGTLVPAPLCSAVPLLPTAALLLLPPL